MTLLRTKVKLDVEGAPKGVTEMTLYVDTDVPDADAQSLASDAVRWLLSHDSMVEEDDDSTKSADVLPEPPTNPNPIQEEPL